MTDKVGNYQPNPQQQQAIETLDGPLLVLAGAGSGKTLVVTYRIARLLQLKKAYPHQILAVTFTNKAAREMVKRVGAICGSDKHFPWINTFHSICFRILKRHARLAGLDERFVVAGDRDQDKALASVLEDLQLDKKRYAGMYAAAIEHWKNLGLNEEDLATKVKSVMGTWELPVDFAKVYRCYQNRLASSSACDFGDLIVRCTGLLAEQPELKSYYQKQFRYVMVDEYQDVNRAQYNWLRELVGEQGNLCCVGDEDQAIYGWRGADITKILGFQRDFPGSQVIRLEENYRSTSEILQVASRLISRNRMRLGKTLRSAVGSGKKIVMMPMETEKDEAVSILACVRELQDRNYPLNEMAIMVRTSSQMAVLEEALLQAHVPYRVIGNLRFYERQEILDAIAYLQLIHNPNAKLAFQRIINVPKRNLGKVSLKKLEAHALANSCTLEEAGRELIKNTGLTKKAAANLTDFINQLGQWRASEGSVAALLERVLQDSGYLEGLQNSKDPSAEGRIGNLNELYNILTNFSSLEDFLEHVALVNDSQTEAEREYLSLTTLHAAKGLEFETVFLPGWEDDILPHQLTIEERGKEGLEEERRLAYVGITRAKRHCFISYCRRRYIFGKHNYPDPSRFLYDIPTNQTCRVDKFFDTLSERLC